MTKVRRTKASRRCGHCELADRVRAGKTRLSQGHYEGGRLVETRLSTEAALAKLAAACRCPDRAEPEPEPDTVPEIRRPGSRILRPGVNVSVQLKRRPGTKKDGGHVVRCLEGDRVEVWLSGVGARVVPADEFVVARQGSTALR